MCLFDTFHGCSGSIKEINRPMLIWKIMSNIYYWEKTGFLKTSIFSERNFERNFEEQKGAR